MFSLLFLVQKIWKLKRKVTRQTHIGSFNPIPLASFVSSIPSANFPSQENFRCSLIKAELFVPNANQSETRFRSLRLHNFLRRTTSDIQLHLRTKINLIIHCLLQTSGSEILAHSISLDRINEAHNWGNLDALDGGWATLGALVKERKKS